MRIFPLLLLISISTFAFSQPSEAYFTSFPTLSPDGQLVVFTFDGDLWKVNSTGGTASRLTAMQGDETRAHISPDGNWLAFSSTQSGNHDVYLMPLNGGMIKQLTFHQGYDHVDGWSWDSKSVYFTSNRSNRNSGYKVSISGGTAVRLFGNFFNTVHSVVEHPSSGEIFFNETGESKDSSRKRYKGAYNPDIQSYNVKTTEFKKYTTYNGKDLWPSLDKTGKLYFASDEANGEYNLYTFENGQKTALTSLTTSIKYPFVNATGDKVVFEKDFQLFLFDVQTKSTQKLSIQVYQNPLLIKEKDFNVQDKLETMSISPDGKKLAFVSRGELFVSDIKGKFVQQMKTNSLGRVLEVRWTEDNKTLVYNQTSENGFLNLFSISGDGKGKELQLTQDHQNNRNITANSEGTKAVYYSGRNEVRLIDLKTLQSQTLVKEELWGFENSFPSLSPNGEYVMFTAYRNFEEDIFLFHIASKKLINLTQTGITESFPTWSPDGLFIYFASDRIKPAYPYGLNDAHIYRLSLEKLDEDFKSGKFDSLFVDKPKEEEKPEEKNAKGKNKKSIQEKTPEVKPYSIDLEDIMQRLEQVSPDFGNQSNPQVFQKDGKTFVLYTSNHEGGTNHLWMTTYEPFEKTKTEKIEGSKDFEGDVLKADDKYYTIGGGNLHIIDLTTKKAEKVEINYTFRRNLANEFTQMFHEVWANLKENFYNEDFHGTNWEAMHKRYESFLPFVNTRANLRTLINDMLGELNSSHLGFNSTGDEEKLLNTSSTLGTGILFDNLDPYKVIGIVKGSPTDKKDKDVKSGDRLIAVNRENVNASVDRDFYFLHPSLDEEITLTFDRAGIKKQVKLHPKPFNEIKSLLYDEWIGNNQKIVDEKGQKRIAYAYMRDMGEEELSKFYIDMNTEAYKRDGLILDLRYNTGGNVHDDVLRFLSQRPYLKWKYREGAFTVQSNFTPAAKPLVLLVNEQSLSDAEMTAVGFKELKLGKIIGTETYRWIIFTSGKGLVDGSFYRLPSWGCYTLDGKNIEKEGVKPDIFVETNFKDRLENRDPQLDKAIEEILKDLK